MLSDLFQLAVDMSDNTQPSGLQCERKRYWLGVEALSWLQRRYKIDDDDAFWACRQLLRLGHIRPRRADVLKDFDPSDLYKTSRKARHTEAIRSLENVAMTAFVELDVTGDISPSPEMIAAVQRSPKVVVAVLEALTVETLNRLPKGARDPKQTTALSSSPRKAKADFVVAEVADDNAEDAANEQDDIEDEKFAIAAETATPPRQRRATMQQVFNEVRPGVVLTPTASPKPRGASLRATAPAIPGSSLSARASLDIARPSKQEGKQALSKSTNEEGGFNVNSKGAVDDEDSL